MNKKTVVTSYNITVEENLQLLQENYAKFRKAKENKKIADDLIETLIGLNVPTSRIAEAMKVDDSHVSRIKRKLFEGGEK